MQHFGPVIKIAIDHQFGANLSFCNVSIITAKRMDSEREVCVKKM